MATAVTAYIDKVGAIHLNKADADRADFQVDCKNEISKFFQDRKIADPDGNGSKLIYKWLEWRGDLDVAPIVVKAENAKNDASTIEKSFKKTEAIEAKPFKKRIAIVGLWKANQGAIEKEFSSHFDMKIYTPDEASQLHGAAGVHKVFAMVKFIGHNHMDALRKAGQEPMLIKGGTTELKAALNAFIDNPQAKQ